MKVIIINGSLRKNNNTAALCKSFSDGLASAGKASKSSTSICII